MLQEGFDGSCKRAERWAESEVQAKRHWVGALHMDMTERDMGLMLAG